MFTPDFHIEIASHYDFAQTLDHLRDSIKAEGFLLLHEIDTQKIVKTHGLEIAGLRQLLFFHPRYIKVILDLNSSAIVEAPLKLIVMENAPDSVIVRYVQPEYLFGRYEGLKDLGTELNNIVTNIAAAVTR